MNSDRMNPIEKKLEDCVESIRRVTDFKPLVALVLGSGLGDYADTDAVKVECRIPYSQIEGFPVSTVAGHKGQFIFGYVEGVPAVIMQGRVHYYEGYAMNDVVLPTRLMGRLGAKVLFLTNAAGGVNEGFHPGDFMVIRDHISVFVPSPLIGPNIDSLGPRFADMSEVYDVPLRQILYQAADSLGLSLQEGVYTQLTGPAYETPAEIRLLQKLGCDAVGMSTVCEAVAANHMGLRICGISCITNMAAGLGAAKLSHAEVQETADRVSRDFKRLVTEAIGRIGRSLTEE